MKQILMLTLLLTFNSYTPVVKAATEDFKLAAMDEVLSTEMMELTAFELAKAINATQAQIDATNSVSERKKLQDTKEKYLQRLTNFRAEIDTLSAEIYKAAREFSSEHVAIGLVITPGFEILPLKMKKFFLPVINKLPILKNPSILGIKGGLSAAAFLENKEGGLSISPRMTTGFNISVAARNVARLADDNNVTEGNFRSVTSAGPYLELRFFFARPKKAKSLSDIEGFYLTGGANFKGKQISETSSHLKTYSPGVRLGGGNWFQKNYVELEDENSRTPWWEAFVPDVYTLVVNLGKGSQVERVEFHSEITYLGFLNDQGWSFLEFWNGAKSGTNNLFENGFKTLKSAGKGIKGLFSF